MTAKNEAGPACGNYRAPFGDAVYDFRLDIDGLRELQEKTDCGPAFLLQKIVAGHWRVDDLREPIRIGLVRGGLDATRAQILMLRYFDSGPLGKHATLAALIVQSAIFEPEEIKTPGKRGPKRTKTQGENSASAES